MYKGWKEQQRNGKGRGYFYFFIRGNREIYIEKPKYFFGTREIKGRTYLPRYNVMYNNPDKCGLINPKVIGEFKRLPHAIKYMKDVIDMAETANGRIWWEELE